MMMYLGEEEAYDDSGGRRNVEMQIVEEENREAVRRWEREQRSTRGQDEKDRGVNGRRRERRGEEREREEEEEERIDAKSSGTEERVSPGVRVCVRVLCTSVDDLANVVRSM